ncbi:MAG: hypothetical protein ABIL46_09085 [candidate division WOR-3 bacterium]
MDEQKIPLEKPDELAGLVLDASAEIFGWIKYINDNIYQELKKHFKENQITMTAAPARIPIYSNNICLISLSKDLSGDYKWGTRGAATLKMPETFVWTMIAMYKPKEKKWHLEIGWGKFEKVRVKNRRKEGSTDIARQLLEVVNENRDKEGTADTDNATGEYKVFNGWKSLFKYSSREKIGELVQEISNSFRQIELSYENKKG